MDYRTWSVSYRDTGIIAKLSNLDETVVLTHFLPWVEDDRDWEASTEKLAIAWCKLHLAD